MPTVMLIEDDATLRSSLCRLLATGDIDVEPFATAEEAVEWLLTGGSAEVVISDHSLPGMQGRDLLRWVAEHRPRMCRILHTACDEVATACADEELAVLVKPAAPFLLRQMVNRALGREMPTPW